MKLGRKAVKQDSRTLKLGKYLSPALVPPASVDWTKGVTSWGMMLNDTLGDCTIAGAGHAIQVWSLNDTKEITLPDSDILEQYEDWCGYNPADPSTDQGGIELDVLNRWKKYSMCGKHLKAFATVNVSNFTEVKNAIALLGGVYIGLNVSNYVMNNETAPGSTWDVVPNDGGIDGGHCVFVCGYDATTLTFISWGSVYKMTYAFWTKYVDEAYALLGLSWVGEGKSPTGLNLTQLEADLAQL